MIEPEGLSKDYSLEAELTGPDFFGWFVDNGEGYDANSGRIACIANWSPTLLKVTTTNNCGLQSCISVMYN